MAAMLLEKQQQQMELARQQQEQVGPAPQVGHPQRTPGSMVGPAPQGGHLQGTAGSVGQAWLVQAEAAGHRKGLGFPPLGCISPCKRTRVEGAGGALSESNQLLPAHPPNSWKGTVNPPVAASLGPTGYGIAMETVWTVIRGRPFGSVPSEKSLWPTSNQANSPSLRCCSFPLSSLLAAAWIPATSGRISVLLPRLNKGTRICCFSPSWRTGDGEPGTTCQLCPVPLFLNHICWALFC